MKRLTLLVLSLGALVAADDQQELAKRIVTTEEECDRLYKLNENWNTKNYNDQAVLYVDLFFLCLDSLAEDKYAYIDQNKVDLTQYPEDDAKFPVMTSEGEKLVAKPPVRSNVDLSSMKAKLSKYLGKLAGKRNPMFNLVNLQSALGQEIVNKQVGCELQGLLVLQRPEDQAVRDQHIECMNKVNCLKEHFMVQHHFNLDMYPDFFPILYKGRGTMINSPPRSEGPSLCSHPANPELYQKDLKKWNIKSAVKGQLKKIGRAAEEKLEDAEDVGTQLIDRLRQFGMTGPGPVMTKEELRKVMDNVESITFLDDDDEDEKVEDPKSAVKLLESYGAKLLDKLGELEGEGLEKIKKKKMDIINDLEPVDHAAYVLGEHIKKFEANKIKPVVKKTMSGLNRAESEVKAKSEVAVEELKDKMVVANEARKESTAILKQQGSVLLAKLMEHRNGNADSNDKENADQSKGWLEDTADKLSHAEYLPKHFANMQLGAFENIMTKLGGLDEKGEEILSQDRLVQMLTTMKNDVKKKAEEMHIEKEEIKQAAGVLKGLLHSILNAGKHGHGPAKSMNEKEISEAKTLINDFVDFATTGLNSDEKEKEDSAKTLINEFAEYAASGLNTDEKDKEDSNQKENSNENIENSPTDESDLSEDENPIISKDKLNKTVKKVLPKVIYKNKAAPDVVIDLTQDDSSKADTQEKSDNVDEKSPKK